jgi:hypothetical protein
MVGDVSNGYVAALSCVHVCHLITITRCLQLSNYVLLTDTLGEIDEIRGGNVFAVPQEKRSEIEVVRTSLRAGGLDET